MSNILIINGAKKFAHSNGQLNDTLTEVADGTLRDLGHDVRIVRADSDYDVKAEVQIRRKNTVPAAWYRAKNICFL